MSLRSTSRFTSLFLLLALAVPLQAQDSEPAPAFTAGQVAAAPPLLPDLDNATTIWDKACAACHGELGQGGEGGVPDIRNTALSPSQVMLVVKEGRNSMPAFAGFTPQELLDVATYVVSEL